MIPTIKKCFSQYGFGLLAWMFFLLPLASVPAESVIFEEHSLLTEYTQLNNAETRLIEFADSEDILNLKLHQLDYINQNRRRAGADPVSMDILACRVANKMAQEAAVENFTGHWNTRGEKPYHRWSFAGGVDHISENAAARWSSAPLSGDLRSLQMYMRQAHDSFINEVPPYDGHRKNCIDPVHTHVGLGVALSGKNFRYYEEYIDRYIEFDRVPGDVEAGEKFEIRARPIHDSFNMYAVIVYYEDFPRPMSAEQVSRKGAYPDYTASQVLALWPWDLLSLREETSRWSRIPLEFDRPGLYYLHIYLSREELPRSGGASTRGKIQGSGVVVRVR